MDLQYLLWLQAIRQAAPFALEVFFAGISTISAVVSLLMPVIVYWCINAEEGLFILSNFCCGTFVNNFLKVTVCAYRPWIKDSRIQPSALAKPGATGYSFPSGHTQTTATTWGVLGWIKRKKRPGLTVFCWIFTLVVAFSRNFLGVHTPQDVLVAILESIVILIVLSKAVPWVHAHPESDKKILITGLALIACSLVYYECKSYPMDYADGVLLVDPLEMQEDAFGGSGVLAGLLLGWFFESKTVQHTAERGKKYWYAGVLGLIPVGIIAVLLAKVIPDPRWGKFAQYAVMIFAAVYLAPLCMKKAEEKGWKPLGHK